MTKSKSEVREFRTLTGAEVSEGPGSFCFARLALFSSQSRSRLNAPAVVSTTGCLGYGQSGFITSYGLDSDPSLAAQFANFPSYQQAGFPGPMQCEAVLDRDREASSSPNVLRLHVRSRCVNDETPTESVGVTSRRLFRSYSLKIGLPCAGERGTKRGKVGKICFGGRLGSSWRTSQGGK